MDVKTYRAKTMRDALALVRRELGPQAAVLHTREVRGGSWLRWLRGARQIEVTASASVVVPSRLPARQRPEQPPAQPRIIERPPMDLYDGAHASPFEAHRPPDPAPADPAPPRRMSENPLASTNPPAPQIGSFSQDDLRGQLAELQSKVEQLCRGAAQTTRRDLPDSLFKLFTDLIDADVSEDIARELVERARRESPFGELPNDALMKGRVARLIEADISVTGPIRVTPGQRHLVALVGPTGVGKTTTIAKLAANYRLREKRRVGLITVDTYRIAAVEQLRTYADIIDLPMEVVSNSREMREAVHRLSDMDLILMDTAGRSPRDEVKIQELQSLLAEAEPDEVHLVLSSVASASTLAKTAQSFAEVGATALILTKLDEATSLGSLLPLLRSAKLPLSYLTNGQNVPDDIEAASHRRLARIVLGMEE